MPMKFRPGPTHKFSCSCRAGTYILCPCSCRALTVLCRASPWAARPVAHVQARRKEDGEARWKEDEVRREGWRMTRQTTRRGAAGCMAGDTADDEAWRDWRRGRRRSGGCGGDGCRCGGGSWEGFWKGRKE
ncbi:unnamed protein product [Linum trigynum]|uniref:Uncharacterized protein n=1 Tax=Linum trigynum TaxID=586398 RepID=A0AAV2CLF5_9ROSI